MILKFSCFCAAGVALLSSTDAFVPSERTTTRALLLHSSLDRDWDNSDFLSSLSGSPDEIAEEIHLPVERVRAVLKMAQQPISLQAPVGDSDDTSFGDFIEDKAAENPMEEAGFAMLKEKIGDVLDTLTEREREVLEQRFGLKDGYSRTLEEVGRQFQVTRERIRQIEAKALRKMRHPTRIRKLEGFIELPNLP